MMPILRADSTGAELQVQHPLACSSASHGNKVEER